MQTQLQTPSSGSDHQNLIDYATSLPTIQNGSTWKLRSIDSNAASSISSPPADDPNYELSYPQGLLPQNCDYLHTDHKASPTSSNEADADPEDPFDTEWGPSASPDESFTDIGISWDNLREEHSYEDAVIVPHENEDMYTNNHETVP